VVNHRGIEFRAELAHTEALIQPILGTSNRVLFFACSGTGVMEASLANIVAPGERLLVAVNGQFGERYAEIGRALGAEVDRIEFPWGEGVDRAAVEERLRHAEYRAIVAIHNESSTGCVSDLAGLGAIVRDRPTLLVVDSVSGLGGVEMRQDAWGVDIVVSASQKALMCPPGVGLASVSPKAWAVVKRDSATPRFYWDFRKAAAAIEKSETPFTAPVALIGGLREALEMIHEEGLGAVLSRHRRLSAALRAGGAALGLRDFTRSDARSSTVVVFEVPEPLEGGAIVRQMYERHRTVIAGARNRLAGRVIRIGTMGSFSAGTILADLLQLEDVLSELGRPVTPGSGVAAAAAALADTTGNE
jgi:aspartate aminotransferase-like enzyme